MATFSKLRRWTRVGSIGGLLVWAVVVISCSTVSHVVMAPPGTVEGATFVGSQECATCHEDTVKTFATATHSRLQAYGPNAIDVGCESCHGPGSAHVQAGGGAGTIVNPKRSPETCFQCHLDKRGEFALPHTHPVMNGKLTCTSCHDPHSGDAVIAGGTRLASINDTCLKCHAAEGGPFVFEHEAAREGCVVCHSPHGSVNDKMLKARNQTLCLQCHFQQQTSTGLFIGGRDHSSFVSRGTCWSAGCHEAVHGSHVNSSLRF